MNMNSRRIAKAIRTQNNQALVQPDQLGHPQKAMVHLKKSHQLPTATTLKQMRKVVGQHRTHQVSTK